MEGKEYLASDDENILIEEVEHYEPRAPESILKKKSGKSIRSEAQKKAFEIARAKRIENGKIAKEKVAEIKEKARKMEFVKEKLAAPAPAPAEESDEEIVVVRKKPKRKPRKIIYETDDDEEDEVIVKPKRTAAAAKIPAVAVVAPPPPPPQFRIKFI
jgi:hypothetical protein